MIKNPPANSGDAHRRHGSGKLFGDGNDNLFQYACLENPMARGACQATARGVEKESAMTAQRSSVKKYIVHNL